MASKHKLLTTVAAMTDATPKYALEGAVFIAGAAVQWLRDGLHLFKSSAEVERLARESNPAEPVLFVPGFVGLGAPHWVPEARGVIFGLTRATTAADLGRAALEGVAFQVADLIDAAEKDMGDPPAAGVPALSLKVDGGMARERLVPAVPGGRARPAGGAGGAWRIDGARRGVPRGGRRGLTDETKLAALGASDSVRAEDCPPDRDKKLAAWRKAVKAVIGFYAG